MPSSPSTTRRTTPVAPDVSSRAAATRHGVNTDPDTTTGAPLPKDDQRLASDSQAGSSVKPTPRAG